MHVLRELGAMATVLDIYVAMSITTMLCFLFPMYLYFYSCAMPLHFTRELPTQSTGEAMNSPLRLITAD